MAASALIDYPRCLATYPSCMDMIPRDALIIYSLVMLTALFAVFISPRALAFHRCLKKGLEDTILQRNNLVHLFVVVFVLDFTFVSLFYLIPFGELLTAVFPALRGIQDVFRGSVFQSLDLLQQKMPTPLAALLLIVVYCLPAFPGPAIVSLGTVLKDGNRKLKPRAVSYLELIQILAYVAVFLAIASWTSGSTPSGGSLELYSTYLLGMVLPGSIVGSVVLLLWKDKV